MMIKIKKDKINEINTKIKSKDIVIQKLAIEVLNSREFFHKALVLIRSTVEFH